MEKIIDEIKVSKSTNIQLTSNNLLIRSKEQPFISILLGDVITVEICKLDRIFSSGIWGIIGLITSTILWQVLPESNLINIIFIFSLFFSLFFIFDFFITPEGKSLKITTSRDIFNIKIETNKKKIHKFVNSLEYTKKHIIHSRLTNNFRNYPTS